MCGTDNLGACQDGPQAEVGAYLAVFRRRRLMFAVVFLFVFAAGVMFALAPRSVSAAPPSSLFTATGVVSLPVVDARAAALGQTSLLQSPMMQEVTGVLSRPLREQASAISSSEKCRSARSSLPEALRETAERTGITSLYLNAAMTTMQVAATGPDAETARVYANTVMEEYVREKNAAFVQAQDRALASIGDALTKLEPKLLTLVRETNRESADANGTSEQRQDNTPLLTSFSEATLALESVSAAFRLVDSLRDQRLTYSEATVSAAPTESVRTVGLKVRLALALIVGLLAAVVAVLVVDSLSAASPASSQVRG